MPRVEKVWCQMLSKRVRFWWKLAIDEAKFRKNVLGGGSKWGFLFFFPLLFFFFSSSFFFVLRGMHVPQIYDDPKGQSISIIQTLFTEMSGLFPDGVFDVGGDETGHTPPCSLNNTRSFEEKMIAYVTQDLGKKVMGWEEFCWRGA